MSGISSSDTRSGFIDYLSLMSLSDKVDEAQYRDREFRRGVAAAEHGLSTTADLGEVSTTFMEIRGNPTLVVTFPQIPHLNAYFVADPGDEHYDPQIIFITEGQSSGNLRDYIYGGQRSYGSDRIVLRDGKLLFDGRTESGFEGSSPAIDMDSDDPYQDVLDSGGDPDTITAEGTSSQTVILNAVVNNNAAREFIAEYVSN